MISFLILFTLFKTLLFLHVIAVLGMATELYELYINKSLLLPTPWKSQETLDANNLAVDLVPSTCSFCGFLRCSTTQISIHWKPGAKEKW